MSSFGKLRDPCATHISAARDRMGAMRIASASDSTPASHLSSAILLCGLLPCTTITFFPTSRGRSLGRMLLVEQMWPQELKACWGLSLSADGRSLLVSCESLDELGERPSELWPQRP
eukprot:1469389-Amphidinium_carterae.1